MESSSAQANYCRASHRNALARNQRRERIFRDSSSSAMRFVSTDSKKKFSPELVACDLKLNRFFACLLEAIVRPSLLAALFHLLQPGPRLIASEHDDLAKLVSEEASH